MSGIMLLRGSSASGCVDIERDLNCVPVDMTDTDSFSVATADANTVKLQAAFDAAADATATPVYAFIIPGNRCFAIGTTPLQLRAGQALIGMGGLNAPHSEYYRSGRTAEPDLYTSGATLMRVEESTNPMILLTAYGNVIQGVNLRGAFWSSDVQFRKPGVANYDYPYYAGLGIEIRNVGGGELSGEHQVDNCSIAFCTTGVAFTWSGVEQQADGCYFGHLQMFEVFTCFDVNNEQAICNKCDHLIWQIPQMTQGSGHTASGSCQALTLTKGGSFIFGHLGLYGSPDTTTAGYCTIVKADATETNCCCVTIGDLFIDAGCLNRGRLFKIARMVNASARDLFLNINGGQLALGSNSIAEQWYNKDYNTVRSNTAQAGGAATITLDASASATTNAYKNHLVTITGGTGSGQAKLIRSYNGTTKVATVVSDWSTPPDATSTFIIRDAELVDVGVNALVQSDADEAASTVQVKMRLFGLSVVDQLKFGYAAPY